MLKKMNLAFLFKNWSKVFSMGEAFPPQIYEPNIQGNYVREGQRKQILTCLLNIKLVVGPQM